MLIGRSVLATHTLEDGEYDSEGYFAVFPEEGEPYFGMPAGYKDNGGESLVDQFREDFDLERKNRELGVSLLLPLPEETVNQASIVKAVIHNWFWEILAEHLKIRVREGGKIQELSSVNLMDFVNTWSGFNEEEKVETRTMLNFCSSADKKSFNDESYFCLTDFGGTKWSKIEKKFETIDQSEKAKDLFNKGQLMAFEVPLEIREESEKKNAQETSFMVYLQKEDDLREPREYFIRDGLTIIGNRVLKEAGVRAAVVAEDGPIAQLLGDAENPAHTRWDPQSQNFRNKYKNGALVLAYVKNSAARLATHLMHREEQRLPDVLGEFFSIPKEGVEKGPVSSKKGRKKSGKPPRVQQKPRYLRIDQSRKGFNVRNHPDATETPLRISIRVCYDLIIGNPFKEWHPADFDFESGPIPEVMGCRILSAIGNRIEVEIENREFSVSCDGFDEKRDLLVDARVIKKKSADDDQKI